LLHCCFYCCFSTRLLISLVRLQLCMCRQLRDETRQFFQTNGSIARNASEEDKESAAAQAAAAAAAAAAAEAAEAAVAPG
jgi:hypothetical protein